MASTDVLEVFLLKADGLGVDSLFVAFTPHLCNDPGFSHWF